MLEVVDEYYSLGIITGKTAVLKLPHYAHMFVLNRTINRAKTTFITKSTNFDSLTKPILLYGATIWLPTSPIIKRICMQGYDRVSRMQQKNRKQNLKST